MRIAIKLQAKSNIFYLVHVNLATPILQNIYSSSLYIPTSR